MLSHINVGSGKDCTIAELAHTVKEVIGYPGIVRFDETKPDGAPRKLMDVSRLSSLGWESKIQLKEGLDVTYQWFLDSINEDKVRMY